MPSFATFTAASIPDRISHQRSPCCYIIIKDVRLAYRYPEVAPLEGLPLLQQKPQKKMAAWDFGAISHVLDLTSAIAVCNLGIRPEVDLWLEVDRIPCCLKDDHNFPILPRADFVFVPRPDRASH